MRDGVGERVALLYEPTVTFQNKYQLQQWTTEYIALYAKDQLTDLAI